MEMYRQMWSRGNRRTRRLWRVLVLIPGLCSQCRVARATIKMLTIITLRIKGYFKDTIVNLRCKNSKECSSRISPAHVVA
jgi:hypothetical protein